MSNRANSEKMQNVVQGNNNALGGNMIQMTNKHFNPGTQIIVSNVNNRNINYSLNNNYANSNDSESRRVKINSKSENMINYTSQNQAKQNLIHTNNLNADNKSIDHRASRFSKSQQSMVSEVVFDDQNINNIKGNLKTQYFFEKDFIYFYLLYNKI